MDKQILKKILLEKQKELLQKTNPIITEDGLFYSNFSDRFQVALRFVQGAKTYSSHLVNLKNQYGIKISKPYNPDNTKMSSTAVGVYIVNFEKYLQDKNMEKKEKKIKK